MERFDAEEEKETFQVRLVPRVPPCCHQSRGRMQEKKDRQEGLGKRWRTLKRLARG